MSCRDYLKSLNKEEDMKIFKKLLLILALVGAISIGMLGCDNDNALEEAGEEVGESFEDAGDAVEDAVE